MWSNLITGVFFLGNFFQLTSCATGEGNKLSMNTINDNSISSIAVSSGIMSYIEGCKLTNYNEIVETDHREYIIDVAIEDYFSIEFSNWDNINKVILNPLKRSHRERFIQSLEE